MTLTSRCIGHAFASIKAYSKHVLRRPLRPYQLAPAQAILDSIFHGRGDTICVAMSRQAGKNETAAQVEAYLLSLFQRRGGIIVKASPTFKPQTINSINRLGQHLNSAWSMSKWRREQGYIIRLGNAECQFFSAQPGSNVVGATASLLLECDEAQSVDPDKWSRDFVPMAATTNATRVFWGTVWTSRTLLAQQMAHCRALESTDGRQRIFLADADLVGRALPAYADHVRAEVRRLGRQHPAVRTQYYLEEIDDLGGLFPPHRQVLMRGQHPRRHEPEPGRSYAFLLDVAGEEEDAPAGGLARSLSPKRDATALTIVEVDSSTVSDPLLSRPTYRTVDRRLWIGVSHSSLYGTLVDLVAGWSPRWLVVDATGTGSGLASFLQARFGRLVLPVTFTASTKTRIGWDFLAIVETGRYKDYANDQRPDTWQFWYEVEACQFETPHAGLLKWGVWESPSYDGLIAKGHDDLLISAALTAILDQQQTGPAESHLIPAPDPLTTYDRSAW